VSLTLSRPPAWLPMPSPAMNAVTIRAIEYGPTPVESARSRCQATW
jgi:hypothetical protein